MANQYPYPDYNEKALSEQGVKVLITDPAADKYLELHRKQQELKEQENK